jgi:hypothetical protein
VTGALDFGVSSSTSHPMPLCISPTMASPESDLQHPQKGRRYWIACLGLSGLREFGCADGGRDSGCGAGGFMT